MIRAFIFDLDGTLVDSEMIWTEAVRHALNRKGCGVSEEAGISLVCGRSWDDIYRDISRMFPGIYETRQAIEAVILERVDWLRSQCDVRIKSSVDLLHVLSMEYPVAIVSGSTRQTIARDLELMQAEDCVDFYLGCEDYSPGKPDPRCFLLAAEIFALPPSDCLVFEDSTAGVCAAKSAGMLCVALKREGAINQDVSGADAVMTDLSEFHEYAKNRPDIFLHGDSISAHIR